MASWLGWPAEPAPVRGVRLIEGRLPALEDLGVPALVQVGWPQVRQAGVVGGGVAPAEEIADLDAGGREVLEPLRVVGLTLSSRAAHSGFFERAITCGTRFRPQRSVTHAGVVLDRDAHFLGAKHVGSTRPLDGVWRRLGIAAGLEKLLAERGYRALVERLLFASVANRALDLDSKLALEFWVADEAHAEGLPEVDVHQKYRATDFLLAASDEVQREAFWSVANLFNLEVGLLLLDTTTAYFGIEGEDPGSTADGGTDGCEVEVGLRKRGARALASCRW